ncbi:glycosyltransferase [Ignatzschineria sp. LJL83]
MNQLNCIPTIITYRYRSQLTSEVNALRSKGKLSKKIPVVNIYDYFQQLKGINDTELRLYDGKFKVSYVGVSPQKYVDENNRVRANAIYNQLNNRLHYITHYHQGKRYRRDYYHEGGQISCTHLLDKDGMKTTQEIFYRYDQSICLIKSYFYKEDGKRSALEIQVMDALGQVVEIFDTENGFIEYFLMSFFATKSEKSILLVDKNRFFYEPALNVKKLYGTDKIKVISAIHNLHAVNYKEKNTSRINSNYVPVFEDLSKADAVVVQTNIQKNDILERFDNPSNIYAIPHTYEAPLTEETIERNPLRAVYFARYDHDKKHELAIEAFAKVVKKLPLAEFHCYGAGSRLAELKVLVKELDMEKNIFLNNWCDSVAKEYEAAGMSIITSPSESFSLTIAESLAHGCPVVGFDVPYGPKELIQSGENGYLVPFGDTDALAEKVITMMSDPMLLSELSQNARLSSKRYSEVLVSKAWNQLLEDIMTPMNN